MLDEVKAFFYQEYKHQSSFIKYLILALFLYPKSAIETNNKKI